MEGAFIAALWYKSASPKPKSLQTQTDLQHREPRAPPRSRPLEQAALPCTTVRPQTETYVTGRRPGKIINFLESFFNGKERRKTPSDILISPWILLVPWCLCDASQTKLNGGLSSPTCGRGEFPPNEHKCLN